MKSTLRRFVLLLTEHPVIASFCVALAARLTVAIAHNFLADGTMVPDEVQYLVLGLVASEGQLTPGFWGGYGQALFDSTRSFMWPVTALFWLFGPTRLVAQLPAVLFGAVTAAGAAALAHRLLRGPYALGAGLITALFPSQILWSSAVLRESLIWAVLAIMAVIVGMSHRKDSTKTVLLTVSAVALLFVVLVWTREHTAVLALWCSVPALLLGSTRRSLRVLCVACLFLVTPMIVGMSPGAVLFAENALARLGVVHAYMSMKADSGFGSSDPFSETRPVQEVASAGSTEDLASDLASAGSTEDLASDLASAGSTEDLASAGSTEDLASSGSTEDLASSGSTEDLGPSPEKPPAPAVAEGAPVCTDQQLRAGPGGFDRKATKLLDRPAGDWVCIHDWEGDIILVDNRLTTGVIRLPHGLYNTMIRPLPWEETRGQVAGQNAFDAAMAAGSSIDDAELARATAENSRKWGRLAAGLESPLWIVVYGLAGYGAWKMRRRYDQIAFPVLIILALSISGALFHGNLGTAFRHRGQMLFALAVLAMGGLQAIVDRRTRDRAVNDIAELQLPGLGRQVRSSDGGGA